MKQRADRYVRSEGQAASAQVHNKIGAGAVRTLWQYFFIQSPNRPEVSLAGGASLVGGARAGQLYHHSSGRQAGRKVDAFTPAAVGGQPCIRILV